MSLDTYANLKTEIAAWAARADMTSYVDSFIDLFEAWANRNLRTRQMEEEAVATADEYIALPADFLQLRDIQVQTNPRVQLQYVTPEFADAYDSSGASGVSKFYTLVGGQIRLIPAPSDAAEVRISYWQKIPALDDSNTTNWLLTAYPDAYLYGALMHARAWVHDMNTFEAIKYNWGLVMSEIQAAGKTSNVGGSLAIRTA